MKLILRRRLKDFIAIIVLCGLGSLVTYYILQKQRLRIPFLEDKAFIVNAEFSTAQAVVPGQGQTVRVAGVRVGDIGGTELREGKAIIKLELDKKFEDLVHADATAFLRPKTGLKDMFVELNPGTKAAPLIDDGGTLPLANTLPDVNPDEVLSALDSDTRDYLKLLIQGAGQGLRGRGTDLRDVLKRFEPTYRDLALVQGEVVKRRKELRRLINSLQRLNTRLAGGDDDLAELVQVASRVFETLASEKTNVSKTIHELPDALEQTRVGLAKVESMANVLRPAADHLIPVVRQLRKTNETTTPFAREAGPIVRDKIRPFVREMRPLARRMLPTLRDLVKSEPGLTRSFTVLNHLFNMLAYNPNGKEGPDKLDRDEGLFFWVSWLAHQTNSIFSNQDAHGVMRALTLGGTCTTIAGTAKTNPAIEQLFGLTGVLTDPAICGGQPTSAKAMRKTRVGGNR